MSIWISIRSANFYVPDLAEPVSVTPFLQTSKTLRELNLGVVRNTGIVNNPPIVCLDDNRRFEIVSR